MKNKKPKSDFEKSIDQSLAEIDIQNQALEKIRKGLEVKKEKTSKTVHSDKKNQKNE
jgi:hypothetical protein